MVVHREAPADLNGPGIEPGEIEDGPEHVVPRSTVGAVAGGDPGAGGTVPNPRRDRSGGGKGDDRELNWSVQREGWRRKTVRRNDLEPGIDCRDRRVGDVELNAFARAHHGGNGFPGLGGQEDQGQQPGRSWQ